jgi:hypothetical protein
LPTCSPFVRGYAAGVPRGWMATSYALLLEIPHFVMQRKMLLGIKQRAERGSQERNHHTRWGPVPPGAMHA